MKHLNIGRCLTLFIILLFSNNFVFAQQKKELDSIKNVLEKVYDLDQNIRDSVSHHLDESGVNSVEYKQALKSMLVTDSALQKIVFGILDKYGWPLKKQTSAKASEGIFFVIQHAPLDAQKKYSTLLDKAFKAGEVEKWAYAFFKDRVNMREGKFQIYGSQTGRDEQGSIYVFPIGDEPNVDKRRRKLGMGPLKDHLKDNGIDDYKRPVEDHYKGKIVLIGHLYAPSKKGIADAEIYLKDELIGKTNDKGFFEIPVNKEPQEKITITIISEGHKTINYPVSGNKDFYEMYMQLK